MPNNIPAQPAGPAVYTDPLRNTSPEGVPGSEIDLPEMFHMRVARDDYGAPVMVKTESYIPDDKGEMDTPQFIVGWGSDRGDDRRDSPDEDTIKVIQARGITLAILADGMGGLANGKDASIRVAEKLAETFNELALGEPDESALTKQWAAGALVTASKAANKAQYDHNQQTRQNSGSTMTVAAVLQDGSYAVANIGDTRTYRVGATKAERITIDHSVVESLVEAGIISREAVYTNPNRSMLYRSMGEKPDVDVDVFVSDDGGELQPGEALGLCCDGIWEDVQEVDGSVVDARKFWTIVQSSPIPREAARRLILHALYGGGRDNLSAIVVRRKSAVVVV